MTVTDPRYGTVDREYAARLGTTPREEDGPIWMVNLMKYRERAEYADGRPSTATGREADDLYAPHQSLRAVGAEVVLFADVESRLLGTDVAWDRVAVVKYPTRRAFIEMQSRPDFQESHHHKDAGMERTFVIGCRPFDLPDDLTREPAAEWEDVPHPPTDDDPPVVVLHVLRFQDADAAGTPAHMQAYQAEAAKSARVHGVRIDGWFEVEGTIVGDGRNWHQVRFNGFPSKAAFMAVVMDPARLEAQRDHREPAIADTYTMILRPHLNRLAASV